MTQRQAYGEYENECKMNEYVMYMKFTHTTKLDIM